MPRKGLGGRPPRLGAVRHAQAACYNRAMAVDPASPSVGAAVAIERVWLDEAARILAASPDVLGVRLLGSSARGEAAGVWWEGRWQRLSDIEMLVVTRSRLSASAGRAIRERLLAAAAAWGQVSPLFQLDLVFRERRRLRSLPPFVFTFEAREAGQTLLGPELGPAIRRVTVASLDRRNTREILFKRLWHLAEALPSDLPAATSPSPFLAAGLRVGVERQALDIPTALLPDTGRLIAGFKARLDSWEREPPPASARIDAWLGRPLVPYLHEVLAARSGASLGRGPWTEAYVPTVAALAGGLDHLRATLAAGAPRSTAPAASPDPVDLLPDLAQALAMLAEAMPQVSRGLFNERPVTPGEAWALLQQAVRIADSYGAMHALRWLRRPRKGLLAGGLLYLHVAGLAIVEGRPAAALPALRAARAMLAAVHADAPAPSRLDRAWGADSAQAMAAWLELRREAGRAFWRVARLGAPAAWSGIEARLR